MSVSEISNEDENDSEITDVCTVDPNEITNAAFNANEEQLVLEKSLFGQEGVVLRDNSAINIENASGVIIGPVTQFHCPVTIQYNTNNVGGTPEVIQNKLNGFDTASKTKLVKSENSSTETLPNEKEGPGKKKRVFTKRQLLVPIIFAVIVVSCGVGIFYSVPPHSIGSNGNDPVVTTPVGENGTTIPDPIDHVYIKRSEWRAGPPKNPLKPMKPSADYIVVCHTATPICPTYKKCISRVQNIQDYQIQEGGFDDISYNFLIGGDGNIYEGRGWHYQSYRGLDNAIFVALIGNFVHDKLPVNMKETLEKFIFDAIKDNHVTGDYSLCAHNQTENTLSPGMELYKEIKTWPHFFPRQRAPIHK